MRRRSGWPSKADAVQIVNFAFLKFAAAPDRRQRNGRASCRSRLAVRMTQNHRPVLQFHRVQVINHFQKAGPHRLLHFLDFFFHAVHDLFHLGFGRRFPVRPVHAGHVRAEIEAQLRVIAEKFRHGQDVGRVHEQRTFARRAIVRENFNFCARHRRFEARFDLFGVSTVQRLMAGGCQTSGLLGRLKIVFAVGRHRKFTGAPRRSDGADGPVR